MNDTSQAVSYATFSQTYESHIQGRTFVENLAYYRSCKQRFWTSFPYIEASGLLPGSRFLDLGGILAELVSRLLEFDAIVGDVNDRARKDVEDLGLKFVIVDLFLDETPEIEGLDLVILTEVIEHIPQPPYVVLGRIKKLLAPGGWLFLTTPNGHRFRNLVYMALVKEILDIYRYPEPGMVLGHQHEYTLKQMLWQAGHAGFETEQADYYEDGFKGASLSARIGRILARPVGIIPHMRNSIAMILRRPVPESGSAP